MTSSAVAARPAPPTRPDRRRLLRWAGSAAVAPLGLLAACGGGAEGTPSAAEPVVTPPATGTPASRSWRLGFSSVPPRPEVDLAVATIQAWSARAELAAVHEEVPWADLLAGADPVALATATQLPRATLLRSLGLQLVVTPELNDGLAREAEAPQLRALGRSLTEPAVQRAWCDWLVAVTRVLAPEWLCLAAETNLVRAAAPATLYGAVVSTARQGTAALRAAGLPRLPRLMTSVQVECAWGRLPGQDGRFQGIATDRSDFPQAELLGLSSYPFLGLASPADLPDDWYARLVTSAGLPAFVTESGWTSPTGTDTAAQQAQQDYVARHAQLLDGVGAVGAVQTFFADIDVASWSAFATGSLPEFAQTGLVSVDLRAKPGLAAWDALHARPLAA